MWCRLGLWIARGEFPDPRLGSAPLCGMQSRPSSGRLNEIPQKHPRALSSRSRGFLSQWKINLAFKPPLCVQDFCELHQHRWQTKRCPNLNRNQSSVTIWGGKSCFVFWLVPQTAAPICHNDWERVTTICFYSLGKKNSILLSSSYG